MASALESAVSPLRPGAIAEWVADAGKEWLDEMAVRVRAAADPRSAPALLARSREAPTVLTLGVATKAARSRARRVALGGLLLAVTSAGWMLAHRSGGTAGASSEPPVAADGIVAPAATTAASAAEVATPAPIVLESIELVDVEAGAPRRAPAAKPTRRRRCDDPMNPKCN
jgi:hypothetical protein